LSGSKRVGGQTDGQTDRYDQANSRFSQFDEGTLKEKWVKFTYTAGT